MGCGQGIESCRNAKRETIQSLRYDLREKFVYCNAKGVVKVKALADTPNCNRF